MPEVFDIFSPYVLSLIVSTGIGLTIGLEREFRKANEKDHFAGIRTFPLVCLLGCVVTFVGNSLSVWLIVATLVAFIAFVAITYFVRSAQGNTGITTEISLIITFVLGMMASQQLIKESLAVMVITTTLLTLKGSFHSFILKITEDELLAFVKFIIICLLLFPFLPDASYGPNGILNPRQIGFVVVVVSAIGFIGYMLVKFIGANKGILLTALFGGMVSSTAVTWTLASKSRGTQSNRAALYAAGITLASSIMFMRVVLVALIFSSSLALSLVLPCSLMFGAGLLFALSYIKKSRAAVDNTPLTLGNPINILNALGFGAMYIAISYLVLYANKFLGTKGLIFSGVISGLADVDAITINMARAAEVTIDLSTSFIVVIVATASNSLVKLMITVFHASREVRNMVVKAMGTMALIAIIFVIYHLI